MYTKLENYLSGYFHTNYWYDEGVEIAQDIISNFTDKDWEQLLKKLPKQNMEWKKKLAYCLYNDKNKYELLTLIELLHTEDKELLEIVLDSLRSFMNQETTNFLMHDTEIVNQIKNLYYHNTSRIIHIMLTDLVYKINQFTEKELLL